MKVIVMLLLALAMLASAPADAAPTPAAAAPAPVTAAAKPVDDLDKMICHVDVETGTRLGTHKECHTKREWIQNQNEQATYLNKNTTSPYRTN